MKRIGFALVGLACIALGGCVALRGTPNYGKDVLDRVRLLDKTVPEIELSFGEPRRFLNVEGIGFYGYDDYGFYFDNIVFVYGKNEKTRIKDNSARVLVVDCLGKNAIMGIVKGKSKVEDLVSALGKPRRIKAIEGNAEEFVLFRGTYYLYPVEEGSLGFRVDKGVVQSILIISKRYGAFD